MGFWDLIFGKPEPYEPGPVYIECIAYESSTGFEYRQKYSILGTLVQSPYGSGRRDARDRSRRREPFTNQRKPFTHEREPFTNERKPPPDRRVPLHRVRYIKPEPPETLWINPELADLGDSGGYDSGFDGYQSLDDLAGDLFADDPIEAADREMARYWNEPSSLEVAQALWQVPLNRPVRIDDTVYVVTARSVRPAPIPMGGYQQPGGTG